MIKEVASVLKSKLAGLPFIEVYAGMVQAVIDGKINEGTNAAIAKKMPVAYDVTGKGTVLGLERQLVPDKSKRGLLYFEDFGSSTDTGAKGGTLAFVSNIRLVAWINKDLNGYDKYDEISANCIASILTRLVSGIGINQDGITRLFLTNPRIMIQDANVFSRYNYDEAVTQYLRPPFEFFGIDFTAKYTVKRTTCG